jgi:hypothetical protein
VGQKRVQLKDQNAIIYFRYVVKTNVFLSVKRVRQPTIQTAYLHFLYFVDTPVYWRLRKYLSKHFKPKIVFALYVAYF